MTKPRDLKLGLPCQYTFFAKDDGWYYSILRQFEEGGEPVLDETEYGPYGTRVLALLGAAQAEAFFYFDVRMPGGVL